MRVNEPAARGGQGGWLKKKKIIDSDNGKRGKKLTQTKGGKHSEKNFRKNNKLMFTFCPFWIYRYKKYEKFNLQSIYHLI